MALGARRSDVLRLIMLQATPLVLIGEGTGLIVALMLTHAVSGLLYGVSPSDPWTVAVAMTVLTLVALTACFAPARSAMKLDPMEALRYE
jgi:ABC-type antimicrobial peptide transport system permease subunit